MSDSTESFSRADFTEFRLGQELNETIYVLVRKGTFSGAVELPSPTLDNGLGHPALDSDFFVDEEGGITISVRLPDLSGKPGTFLLGDNSFELSAGRVFVLNSDWQADQIPAQTLDDAYLYLEKTN